MSNKKGMSVLVMVLIVIGIILLAMLIIGFSFGWQIFGFGMSIGDVIEECSIAATSDSEVSYCNKFTLIKETEGKNYVNCQYSKVEEALDKKLSCGGKSALQSAQEYAQPICSNLVQEKTKEDAESALGSDKMRYNGKMCNELFTMMWAPGATPEVGTASLSLGTGSAPSSAGATTPPASPPEVPGTTSIPSSSAGATTPPASPPSVPGVS